MGNTPARMPSSTDLPPGDPAAFTVPADADITKMHVLPQARRSRKLTDHYRLPETDDELGRGHYGVVRVGTRIIDNEKFAIKTIVKKRPLYVLMLRNEIRILEQCEHPYIVKLVDSFEEPDVVHLVFEIAAGGELFDPIADVNFWFEEHVASRIMRQALAGLAYLHDARIVHRDIKPENILLTSKDYANAPLKVIDFGLATKLQPKAEHLRKHVGTPYYIAPEVLAKKYNESCDVWSFGVVLYTICVAYPPFWGNTEAEIYSRIRKGTIRFQGAEWDRRSDHVKDLVRRMLTSNVEERVDVHAALNHPWIAYEGEPTLDPTTPRILQLLRLWTSFPWLKRLHILIAAQHWKPPNDGKREQVLWSSLAGDESAAFITMTTLQDALDHIGVAAANAGVHHVAATNTAVLLAEHLSGPAAEQYASGLDFAQRAAAAHEEGGTRKDLWAATPSAETARLLAALDTGATGRVTFEEFLAWACPRTVYLQAATIVQSFNFLDVDGDGLISGDDLFAAAGRLEALLGNSSGQAGEVNVGHYAYHIVKEACLVPDSALRDGIDDCDPEWHSGVPAPYNAGFVGRSATGATGSAVAAKAAAAEAKPLPPRAEQHTSLATSPGTHDASMAQQLPLPVSAQGATHSGGATVQRSGSSARRPPPTAQSLGADKDPAFKRSTSKLQVYPAPQHAESLSVVQTEVPAVDSKSAARPAPAADPASPHGGAAKPRPKGGLKGGARGAETGTGVTASSLPATSGAGSAPGGGPPIARMPSAGGAPGTVELPLPNIAGPVAFHTTEQLPLDDDGMPAITLGMFLRVVTGNEQHAF